MEIPQTALDTLKQALVLEKRGRAFYAKTAEQATVPGLKDIFLTLAEEEGKHIEYLNERFAEFTRSGSFPSGDASPPQGHLADLVLTDEIKNSIDAAEYEAAAVSAAIELEKRAISLYSKRARSAGNEDEREFYRSLAAWEDGHLELLVRLDDELLESIWNENNYWPF
jgi:rubrerythrin